MAESKTLGELGTGTVNLFLVGLLKVEKYRVKVMLWQLFSKDNLGVRIISGKVERNTGKVKSNLEIQKFKSTVHWSEE